MTTPARLRGAVVSVALAVGLSSCGPARSPALVATLPPGYDARELLDVTARDAVDAISTPAFEPVSRAAHRLARGVPVVVVRVETSVKAYPIDVLIRHEVVNDRVADLPVAVTYSPLADAAVVFERRVGTRDLAFGVSGKLYRGGLVMYDRTTLSLWPQMFGTAVAGELAGRMLRPVPSSVVAFATLGEAFPDAEVLAPPGPSSAYGETPYAGYDGRSLPPERLVRDPADYRRPPMARAAFVPIGSDALGSYPHAALDAHGAVAVTEDVIAGKRAVIMYAREVSSPLDSERIADGRRVGATGIFEPVIDGQPLAFEVRDGRVVDTSTGSVWSVLGVAVSGAMKGRALAPVHHVDAFWFMWSDLAFEVHIWAG